MKLRSAVWLSALGLTVVSCTSQEPESAGAGDSTTTAAYSLPDPFPLAVGDDAVDFELASMDNESTFKLSSNFGSRPTVLIFGSYT
jgi:hypothetical protein